MERTDVSSDGRGPASGFEDTQRSIILAFSNLKARLDTAIIQAKERAPPVAVLGFSATGAVFKLAFLIRPIFTPGAIDVGSGIAHVGL